MWLSRFAARFSPRKSATEPPARSQQTFATQQYPHAAEHQNSDKSKQLAPIDAEQAPVIQKVYSAVTNTGKREQPSSTKPGRSMSPSEILMLPNVDKGKQSLSTNPGQARILQSSPNTVEDVDKGKEPFLIDHQQNAHAAEIMNKGKQTSPVDLEKAFPAQQSTTAAEAMDTQTIDVMKPQIPKPIDKGKQRMSGSLYSSLSKNPHEIRVLEIIDTTGEKLECQMHTVVLGANLKFSALSYVWGDPTDPHNQVVIIVNGRDKVVTRSLESALRHAGNAWKREFPRRPLSSFRLWADAVCINQDDSLERNHQAGLMASIYSQADVVLAWLGLDPNGVIHLAFESLRKVWNAIRRQDQLPGTAEEAFNLLRDQTALYGNPGPGEERAPIVTARWEAVSHFHDLPNWMRVWTCQEFVLARRLVMYTPSVSGDIEAIGRADRVLLLAFSHILNGTVVDTDIPIIVRALPQSFSPSKNFLELFMTRAFHKLPSYTEDLSRIGFGLNATDRRDHVFGMLSVSNLDMQVDYTKSFRRVQIEYVAALLRSQKFGGAALLAIFRRAAPRIASLEGAPSWVPFPESDGVGTPPIRNYGTDTHIRFTKKSGNHFVNNQTLCLPGTQLGIVQNVWDFGKQRPQGRISPDWLRVALRAKLAQGPMDAHTLRIIVLLFFKPHEISKGMYAIIAIYMLIMIVGYDDDDTIHPDALNLRGRLASFGLGLGPESFMESFCKMFGVSVSDPRSSLARRYVDGYWGDGKATWNSINGHESGAVSPSLQGWEFYKPAEMEGGKFGRRLIAVSIDTEVGDSICAFPGSSQPYVLRRHSQEEWQLVGPCGIAEIRKGIFVDKMKLPARTKVETFQIV
ncbi:hypothetical protein GGTG_13392 [Gaeumannomyces tritici R3-111a-1]|uniref:Heterokaryon incompatibility domain-containing protein n=1 Tax=Gaeumannomyces tritici (strain R3-111a-1) TaxID=644352 RepID=J3PIR3_GAET3|nr:hypothetical protein GGTG_13392 [Gaeumannomyces tritici R3-111a-1]EJT68995.1 hypothetical protein GGTG_13392 [Gaeumannomyces tritici R3-111a-1]